MHLVCFIECVEAGTECAFRAYVHTCARRECMGLVKIWVDWCLSFEQFLGRGVGCEVCGLVMHGVAESVKCCGDGIVCDI